jgi:hypothetical protein
LIHLEAQVASVVINSVAQVISAQQDLIHLEDQVASVVINSVAQAASVDSVAQVASVQVPQVASVVQPQVDSVAQVTQVMLLRQAQLQVDSVA